LLFPGPEIPEDALDHLGLTDQADDLHLMVAPGTTEKGSTSQIFFMGSRQVSDGMRRGLQADTSNTAACRESGEGRSSVSERPDHLHPLADSRHDG
jgi:hypothetical protein